MCFDADCLTFLHFKTLTIKAICVRARDLWTDWQYILRKALLLGMYYKIHIFYEIIPNIALISPTNTYSMVLNHFRKWLYLKKIKACLFLNKDDDIHQSKALQSEGRTNKK